MVTALSSSRETNEVMGRDFRAGWAIKGLFVGGRSLGSLRSNGHPLRCGATFRDDSSVIIELGCSPPPKLVGSLPWSASRFASLAGDLRRANGRKKVKRGVPLRAREEIIRTRVRARARPSWRCMGVTAPRPTPALGKGWPADSSAPQRMARGGDCARAPSGGHSVGWARRGHETDAGRQSCVGAGLPLSRSQASELGQARWHWLNCTQLRRSGSAPVARSAPTVLRCPCPRARCVLLARASVIGVVCH